MPGSVQSATVRLLRQDTPVPAALALSTASDAVTLTPESPLEPNAEYQIVVEGVLSQGGEPLRAAWQSAFRTDSSAEPAEPFTAEPLIGSELSSFADILIAFSQPVDPASVTAETVWLDGPHGDRVGVERRVPARLTVSASGMWARLNPDRLLAAGALYQLTIRGVQDVWGRSASGGEALRVGYDLRPGSPKPLRTGILDGAIDIPTNPTITILFSRLIDPASVTAATARLTGAGELIGLRVQPGQDPGFDQDGRYLRLVPERELAPGREYKLYVSGLLDVTGLPQTEAVAVAFRTSETEAAPQERLGSSRPIDYPFNASRTEPSSIRFREPVDAAYLETPIRASDGTWVDISLSRDQRTVTATPRSPLDPQHPGRIGAHTASPDQSGSQPRRSCRASAAHHGCRG